MDSLVTRIFSSRKVWIALGTIATCIVVMFGASEKVATELTTAIATIGSVVIAAIGLEDAGAKFGTGPQNADGQSPKQDITNGVRDPIIPIWAGLLLAGLCFGGIGCATDPSTRWAQARDALSVAQDSVGHAVDAKLVTPDQVINLYDPIFQSARAALDAALLELPAGGDAFDYYINLAIGVLQKIDQKQIPRLSPTTRPGKPELLLETHHARDDFGWIAGGVGTQNLFHAAGGDRSPERRAQRRAA